MKQITFKTTIAAAKQKVWDTMLHPTTYAEWVDAAWPGSIFEGSWKQGSNMRFISVNGSGTLATLVKVTPLAYILAKHIAVLLPGGIVDKESEVAKGWIGTTEAYHFLEAAGTTVLEVTLSTNPEWEKMFADGWPKALEKLKQICER